MKNSNLCFLLRTTLYLRSKLYRYKVNLSGTSQRPRELATRDLVESGQCFLQAIEYLHAAYSSLVGCGLVRHTLCHFWYKEAMMAKPIKETPILCGKDSKTFSEKIARNKEQPASKEEYDRVMANYRKVKADVK